IGHEPGPPNEASICAGVWERQLYSFSYTTRVMPAASGGLGVPRMISTSESVVPGTWQLQPPSMHMAIWTISAFAPGMNPKNKAKPKSADASLFLMGYFPDLLPKSARRTDSGL